MSAPNSRRFALLFFFFVLFATAFPQGEIRQAEDWLVQRAQHRSLDSLKEKLGYPDPPVDKGLVVLFTVGGAASNVLVVGPISGNARAYAEALNGWQAEFGGKEAVRFSQEDDCAAARLDWNRAKFLNLRTDQTFDVAALVGRLEKVATPVRTAVRVPNYAEATGLGQPNFTTATASVYEVKPGAGPIRVLVELSNSTPALFWLFVFFVPACGIAGLLAGIWVGSQKSIPLEKRRKIYSKVALYPTIGSIAIHAPFAFFMLTTRRLTPMADLWFGTSSTVNAFLPLIMSPVLFVMLVAFGNSKIEKHLFGPTEGEAQTIPPAPERSEEQKAFDLRVKRIGQIVMAVGGTLWIGSMFIDRKSEGYVFARIGGMMLFLFASHIARLTMKAEAAKFEGELEAAGLEMAAQRLGEAFGLPVRSLRISRAPLEVMTVRAWYANKKARVTVTQRAVQVMDPSEIEFLIARELAAVKLRHPQKRLVRGLPLLLVALPIIYIGFRIINPAIPGFPTGFFFALQFVGMACFLLISFSAGQRDELDKDREALLVTRDLSVALAAVWKMQMTSPLPHMEDVIAKHPKIAERLAALRQVDLRE